MAESNAPLQKPHKTNFTAVRFSWNDGSDKVFALTDWPSNVTLPGISGGFSSEPTMETQLAAFKGVLNEQPTKITIPDTYDLAALLTSGSPAPFMTMEVWQFTQSSLTGDDRVLKWFSGVVSLATKNVDGKPGRVRIEGTSLKARLAVALGLQANHQCIWEFGGFGCGNDGLTADVYTASPTQIERNRMRFYLIGAGSGPIVYTRGYVELDGLRIGIRSVGSDASEDDIFLFQEPPPSWTTSRTYSVVEGCNKLLSTCQNPAKNNEKNFGGFGYAMPSRHPMLETH